MTDDERTAKSSDEAAENEGKYDKYVDRLLDVLSIVS